MFVIIVTIRTHAPHYFSYLQCGNQTKYKHFSYTHLSVFPVKCIMMFLAFDILVVGCIAYTLRVTYFRGPTESLKRAA